MEKYPLFSKSKNGTLLRNYYCSDCLVGPFSEDDIRRNIFIKTGGEKQSVNFCRKCYTMKFHTTGFSELPIEYKKREKYITSGKALEDLHNNISKIFEHKENVIEHGIHEDEKLEITKKVPENISEIKQLEIIPELMNKTTKDEAAISVHRIHLKDYQSKDSISTKSIKNYSLTPPVIFTPDNKIDLEKMLAKEIINYVKEKIGKLITIPTKSKKRIIKTAIEYLSEVKEHKIEAPVKVFEKCGVDRPLSGSESYTEYISEIKKVSFEGLSAKDIINLVQEKTGQLITISPKSKNSILRHAKEIFEADGFSVN